MHPKDNLLNAIRRNHPLWVPNGLENTIRISPPIIERPTQAGYDAWGAPWSLEQAADGGTYPTCNGHPIKDITGWANTLCIPSMSDLDWSPVKRQADCIDRDENLVMGFVEMGLFERSYILLGMTAALMAYLDYPDIMQAMLRKIADYKIELISRFHEVARLDIVWYGDDWGTQSNLFLPIQVWRGIIKPETKRIYDCMKQRGIIINQHSCGKIEAIIGDMVTMGADMWNPCQPCNHLAELKTKYGDRLTFCGGIDSQFVLDRQGVTPDEVRAEVRMRINEMAYGGGYIAMPSHSVPYDQAIVSAMNDEINTYGKQYYRDHLLPAI